MADLERLLDELTADDSGATEDVPEGLPPRRKRGRPPGGRRWAQAAEAALNREGVVPAVRQNVPQPGDIAYARQVLQQKRQKGKPLVVHNELAQLPKSCSGVGLGALVSGIGSDIQQLVGGAILWHQAHSTGDERPDEPDEVMRVMFRPMRPHLSVSALHEKFPGQSVATLHRGIRQTASAALEAACLWWGGLLRAAETAMEANHWEPWLCCSKMLYDETPLKVRVRQDAVSASGLAADGQNKDKEASEHAKVFQMRHSVHLLFYDPGKQKCLVIGGTVPVPLQLMENSSKIVTKACLKTAQDCVGPCGLGPRTLG